jgi:repressor of nif and glnA expression
MFSYSNHLGAMGVNIMAHTNTVIKMVRDNINSALEGGYNFDNYTDEDLAGDLVAYAADLENKTFEQILQAVKAVRAEGIACQKR